MANLPYGGFRDAESIGDITRWLASLKREEDFAVIVGDWSVEKDMLPRRLVACFRPLSVEESEIDVGSPVACPIQRFEGNLLETFELSQAVYRDVGYEDAEKGAESRARRLVFPLAQNCHEPHHDVLHDVVCFVRDRTKPLDEETGDDGSVQFVESQPPELVELFAAGEIVNKRLRCIWYCAHCLLMTIFWLSTMMTRMPGSLST